MPALAEVAAVEVVRLPKIRLQVSSVARPIPSGGAKSVDRKCAPAYKEFKRSCRVEWF